MGDNMLLVPGDRILYRTRHGGMLHEGLIREDSRIAYKINTVDGAVWLEKGSIQVVEVLPKQREQGGKDVEEDERDVTVIVNDG